jgi:hypothetical protein
MTDGFFGGRWGAGGGNLNCYAYAVHHRPETGGAYLEPGELSGEQWSRPRDAAHFWALVQRDGAISVSPQYVAAPPQGAMPARGSNPGFYLMAMALNSRGMENYHCMRRDELTGVWWQTSLGLSRLTGGVVIFRDDTITHPHLDPWVNDLQARVHPLDLWVGYFWVPVRGLQRAPVNPRRGCCYITTATCQALGRPDDCDELETLRWFRDHVLLRSASGRRDVGAYYRDAPRLVAAIEARSDAAAIYARMLRAGIEPAVAAVKSGDYERAYLIFRREVEALQREIGSA